MMKLTIKTDQKTHELYGVWYLECKFCDSILFNMENLGVTSYNCASLLHNCHD